jgi:RNA polymerase sigma-70 factor (ECF subfamily)
LSFNPTYNISDLVQRFQAGEEAAFKEIYLLYHKRVLFFARRFVSDQDAQDITSDSFIQLWQKRSDFPSEKNISTFLFVTARNRCFNLLEHEKVKLRRKEEITKLKETETIPNIDLEDTRLELLALIHQELNRLPRKMREIFILSFEEGLKPAEIAQRLQISVKTVSNQKLTAIKLLKKALSDHPSAIIFPISSQILWEVLNTRLFI